MSKPYASRCETALHRIIGRADDVFDSLWVLAVKNAQVIDRQRVTHYMTLLSGLNEIRRLHRQTNLMYVCDQFPTENNSEAKDYIRLIHRALKIYKELNAEYIRLKG